MGTEIKAWQLIDGQLREIQEDDFSTTHLEKDLEEWIERDPSLLGAKLLVIGRQHDIPNVGQIDLLCIDETGALVLVEFKRSLTNRETVAQILDYASWLDAATAAEINDCALNYLEAPLSDAFVERFGNELQPLTPQNHRMIVVAPKLDSSAERIINYLAERYKMNINAVFFRYAKTKQGDEILIRTVLVPEAVRPPSASRKTPTVAELLAWASDRKIAKLVEICRTLSPEGVEKRAPAFGGSFRYWFKDRMIFGVNVAGEMCKPLPAPGELDVWIPVPTLADVVVVPKEEIREALKQDFAAIEKGMTDCVVRLKSLEQARKLVSLIRAWVTTPASAGAIGTASPSNENTEVYTAPLTEGLEKRVTWDKEALESLVLLNPEARPKESANQNETD